MRWTSTVNNIRYINWVQYLRQPHIYFVPFRWWNTFYPNVLVIRFIILGHRCERRSAQQLYHTPMYPIHLANWRYTCISLLMSPMKRENVRKQNQNQSGEKINRTKIALDDVMRIDFRYIIWYNEPSSKD